MPRSCRRGAGNTIVTRISDHAFVVLVGAGLVAAGLLLFTEIA